MSEEFWPGTKICQKKNLKSPQWLRNIKIKKNLFGKFSVKNNRNLIKDAGWHFSFLKNPSQL